MTNSSAGACLTPNILELLAHDGLSPSELAEIEEHVSSCEKCRSSLEVASSDAEWTNDIRPVLTTPVEPIPELDDCEDLGIDPPRYDSVLKLLGPTDDPNMLGRIGSYEIVGVIGRGGMGVVFKAFDPTLNRFVAIKMLLPHLAESGAARRRFAREGQAAAAVVNDHVLPIYSVAEWQGVPYLVTQFLRGSTLQKRIQQTGPLELKEIIRIGIQTARGLAAAHAQGLVHRDVKPSNILLDGTVERAMLTDFGLARAVDDASITRTGIISGTPQFMSPEQANGDPIDHRSDLFSLGSVLYAMCTGRPPFRAESTFGVLRRIRETMPRSILEVNGDIPAWMEGIVSKLLAKDQAERFATAEEVADVLEQCLAHVQQPTVVSLPRAVGWAVPTSASVFGGHSPPYISGAKQTPSPAPLETRRSLTSLRNGRHTRRYVRWVLLVFAPVVGAALFMYWKTNPRQSSRDDSPGHSESQSAAIDPATEWNADQFAFDAVETELATFESEMQRDLDNLETEFSPTSNSSPEDIP